MIDMINIYTSLFQNFHYVSAFFLNFFNSSFKYLAHKLYLNILLHENSKFANSTIYNKIIGLYLLSNAS